MKAICFEHFLFVFHFDFFACIISVQDEELITIKAMAKITENHVYALKREGEGLDIQKQNHYSLQLHSYRS